ncbi:hypothetical protein PGT21_019878 [Puccinia graminis f. sp. tritici]|uniref:Uncharacterized protein n=1 Tax=Puccinia graminis f. sp. tritici TaxID=56615 RepID=A0A5B0P8L3_PUCGR|nr:hypothetical protein PGT21_032521 [Puccinia graminis f. sp. tritici]KAA1099769.1 hypothetical protein PGT21_019878 [Puccinia graminis f. sp. tritici]
MDCHLIVCLDCLPFRLITQPPLFNSVKRSKCNNSKPIASKPLGPESFMKTQSDGTDPEELDDFSTCNFYSKPNKQSSSGSIVEAKLVAPAVIVQYFL